MKTLQASRRLAFAALAMCSTLAVADDLQVTLSGDQEVPPVSTAAKGSGTIAIKPDMSVAGSVATTGMAGTLAHIHQGAAGANGPVLVTLSKSGEGNWAVPAGTKLTDAQYKAFKKGELYINVHSAEHKNGEIRGQIKP